MTALAIHRAADPPPPAAPDPPPGPATPPASLPADSAANPALLFTRKELGDALRVSPKTIDRMDQTGKLPRPVRIGQARRWRRATIERWLAEGCPTRAAFESASPSPRPRR